MNLMCYQQNLLVRNKIEPGHATGSLALSLTHPWYRAGKAQVQLPRSRKCCSGTSQASLFLLVDKPWTLCAYWASNILARATGNGDVLTHWASGFQNFFLPCDVFKRQNKTSRGLTDLFCGRETVLTGRQTFLNQTSSYKNFPRVGETRQAE